MYGATCMQAYITCMIQNGGASPIMSVLSVLTLQNLTLSMSGTYLCRSGSLIVIFTLIVGKTKSACSGLVQHACNGHHVTANFTKECIYPPTWLIPNSQSFLPFDCINIIFLLPIPQILYHVLLTYMQVLILLQHLSVSLPALVLVVVLVRSLVV